MQILIVDLGSQYTLLIGRALRELGVRSIILPPRKAEQWLDEHLDGLKGIIISGGAANIGEMDPADLAPSILTVNRPILGICLGLHWIAQAFGGKVASLTERRGYGEEILTQVEAHDALFRRVTRTQNVVWMSHGDSVTKLPPGFYRIAQTEHCPIAAMGSDDGVIFGVQFHPEVKQTECGLEIFLSFLDRCGVVPDWKPLDVVERIRAEVRAAMPDGALALLAFSGGVDSSTLAAIISPVLDGRLACVTIDAGNLRQGELDEIRANAVAVGCKTEIIECSGEVIPWIGNWTTDAEEKRRRFQQKYLEKLEQAAARIGAKFLIQATLAPDVIESGGVGEASVIVTHHNVGLKTRLRQLHPLAKLFKYEVRELARHLKLPPSISERKPFPGPGIFCRVVGTPVTTELLETVRWADAEVRQIVAEAGLESEFDQLVVALLCVSVAGVKGDGRAYAYLAGVRAVKTSDFMTCRGYQFPPRPDNPAPIRKRIEKALVRHSSIVGVVFDETDKPPRRTEFE